MEPHTLEGTEILLHAPELAGQRVKLTVLIDETSNHQPTTTLDKLLKNRVGEFIFSHQIYLSRQRQLLQIF